MPAAAVESPIQAKSSCRRIGWLTMLSITWAIFLPSISAESAVRSSSAAGEGTWYHVQLSMYKSDEIYCKNVSPCEPARELNAAKSHVLLSVTIVDGPCSLRKMSSICDLTVCGSVTNFTTHLATCDNDSTYVRTYFTTILSYVTIALLVTTGLGYLSRSSIKRRVYLARLWWYVHERKNFDFYHTDETVRANETENQYNKKLTRAADSYGSIVRQQIVR